MFVFPLISRNLLSDKTANETGLIHASIEVIYNHVKLSLFFSGEPVLTHETLQALKVICHLSPWLHYERILKQYVMEMRKNIALRKQAIRIISAILDSFHFDISQAIDDSTRKSQPLKTLEKARGGEPMEIDDESNEPKKKLEPAVKWVTVLCRSDAIRVYKSIKSFLVPSLDRLFMTYEDADQYHKLSKKGTRDEKEEMAVLSIPIAYAAVKLLKKLPPALLDKYIPT